MTENQPKRLMLMFTIGPAQSFIEASRKTEDLWMGSYILSYLTATAIDRVQGDGVELIYPAIGSKPPFEFWKGQDFVTPSIPNLFLAIGDGTLSQDDLAKCARDAESEVNTVFEQMAKRLLDEAFEKNWRKSYVENLFNKQIPGFFDIYWVITEEEIGQKYGKWYAHTAGSLAAIKNCRTFNKPVSEFGRKCSLDGTREILHLEENESIEQAMKWWEDFAKRTPRHCRQKEALCAVSLTKRMGMHYLENYSRFKDEFKDKSERPKFPSTSEVATANFKERILCKPDAFDVYTKFCKAVIELRQSDDEKTKIPIIQPLPKIKCPIPNNVDGEWLYEETWNPSYLERYYNIDWESQQKQIEHCEDFRKKLVGILEGEPGKYYAAIALDADNMGEVNRNTKNREEHEANSRQLIEYTEVARRVVEGEHLGKLTYAGGDDLFALANLRDLLPMLEKLYKYFPHDLTTISAGVCIAHNKMPLTNVLGHARRMEKIAKTQGERDAVSIALYKHSGNISQTTVKWIYNKQKVVQVDMDTDNSFKTKWCFDGLKVISIGEQLVKLLQDDEVSKNFLYAFRDAVAKLIGDEEKLLKGVLPLVEVEFKRLIERAYKTKGKELDDSNQQTIQKTAELLHHISLRSFKHFLGFLEIITFIARESK